MHVCTSAAFAYNDNYVILKFFPRDRTTPDTKSAGATVRVHKYNSGSKSYTYDRMARGSNSIYRYAENVFSSNTYTGYAWDDLTLPNAFSASAMVSSWKDPHTYGVIVDPPKDYMVQPQFTIRLPRTNRSNPKPNVGITINEKSGGVPTYLSSMPGVTVVDDGSAFDINRLVVHKYTVAVEMWLKRKQIKTLKLEVPSSLLGKGYFFVLEPTNGNRGLQIPFGNPSGSGATTVLTAMPAPGDAVEVGSYNLLVRDRTGATYKSYPVTIEPLRIPREAAEKYPQFDALYLMDPLKWPSEGISLQQVTYMLRALDKVGASYVAGSKFAYSAKIASTENYWGRIVLPANNDELIEKEPTDVASALTDHVLKFNINDITIRKEWASGQESNRAVSISCTSGAEGSRSLTLSGANNWQQQVTAKANDVLTFTEGDISDYAPYEWRLTDANSAEDGIKLPVSKDGKTAKLDLRNGTGVESGSSLSASDLSRARQLVASGNAMVTVKNRKVKVFSAEKKWVIDTLSQDRPSKIKVALQKRDDDEKKWKNVETVELSSANGWKANFKPVSDEGSDTEKKYRVRELDESGKKTVWAKGDPDVPETKSLLERITDWDQLWQQDDLTEYLKGNVKTTYEPTVVYSVSGISVSGSGVAGPHKTKYYATYNTSGTKTTITNTAVLDVTIYKRWLMFGSSKKPESVNLMLFGRTKSLANAGQDAGGATVPYLPVTDTLYGDGMKAADIADVIGLKSVLTKIPGVTEEKINQWIKVGLALGKAKPNKENMLTGWRVKFGVKKYNSAGQEQEFLGAEMVTGLIKIGTDVFTGYSFPAMLQPLSPRYLTVYGKAYKVPALCKDFERTSNVINTWLKVNFEPGVAIGGTKYWEGDTEKDRPKEVTLHIYQKVKDKDGKETKKECKGSPIKIKKSDGWAWSFALPKPKEGEPKVEAKDLTIEEEVPSGYSVRYDGFDIFNKKDETETITIKGYKTWDDANDAQKKRPTSITIRLKADGVEKETRVVDEDGNWGWAFAGLPKYKKVNGKDQEISYTITEDEVGNGYEAPKVNGYDVTNTLKQPETVDVTVRKAWANTPDDKYPKTITLRLLADGVEKDVRKTTEESGWGCTFSGLPVYKEGSTTQKINYTVTEDRVPGFLEPEIDLVTENDFRITNTYDTSMTSVHVQKEWDDEENTQARPSSVEFQLYADGVAQDRYLQVDAVGHWRGDFTGLPRRKAGKEIAYSVKEVNVVGYKSFVEGDAQEGFTVTNVYDPEVFDLTVYGLWDDQDNTEGIRPPFVKVNLIADGAIVRDGTSLRQLTLTAENGWSDTFDGLPVKAADGHTISYRVRVPRGPADPTSSTRVYLGGNGTGDSYIVAEDHSSLADGFVNVQFTHLPQKLEVKGVKVWQGDEDAREARPGTIGLQLYRNGEAVPDARIEATGWDANENEAYEWSFGEWDQYSVSYEGIVRNVYTVKEDPVTNYKTTYEGDALNGFTITNTYDPVNTNITVTAIWADENDLDGIRPESFYVMLIADGQALGSKRLTLSADGGWTGTFEDLPMRAEDGHEIEYKIRAPRGQTDYKTGARLGGGDGTGNTYTVAESSVQDGLATILLTHKPSTMSLTVNKVWDDEGHEGERPQRITVHVYGNGQLAKEGTLDDDGWSQKFENLKKFDKDGNPIYYTVKEDPVPDYTTTYDGTLDGYTITNTYAPDRTSLTVSGLWFDSNDKDGIRPESVSVLLLADGSVVEKDGEPWKLELNAGNGWMGAFQDLPRKDGDDNEITYTAMAERDAERGIGDIDGPGTYVVWEENYDSVAFVNFKHTPQTIDITGTKVWEDENNKNGVRPGTITVRLFAKLETTDGQEVQDKQEVAQVTLSAEDSEDNEWTWEFEDMPLYTKDAQNARRIMYTVSEDAVPNYVPTCTGDMNEGFVITNKLVRDQGLTVSGIWHDENDKDGIRPSSVTVLLLADGEPVEEDGEPRTITLTAENGWVGTFGDLVGKDADGSEIVYTAQVQRNPDLGIGDVDGPGTYAVVEHNTAEEGGNVALVDLTHTPLRVDITGAKVWDDVMNHDAVRPQNVTIHLLADGKEVDQMTVDGGDEKDDAAWSWQFKDKPAYEGVGSDASLIDYTVSESHVPNYTTQISRNEKDEWVVVNKHELEEIAVSVQNVWEDDNDSKGLRPDSANVRLYAAVTLNGEQVRFAVDERAIAQSDGWKYVFDGLLRSVDGTSLSYDIAPDAVPGYTTTLSGDAQTGFVITHRLNQTTTVAGHKHWEDDENAYGKRPESIVVYLLADGVVTDSRTVTAQDDWSWSFEGLPLEEKGKLINYSVAEGAVADYDVEVSGHDIQNIIDPSLMRTSVNVRKDWVGDEDALDRRPAEVTVYLLADGSVLKSQVMSANDKGEWVTTFDDLPVFDDDYGVIDYTVAEGHVAGYDAAISRELDNSFVITNALDEEEPPGETTTVEGDKTWEGESLDHIVVYLLVNDAEVVDMREVSAAQDWKWSFGDLPVEKDGQEVSYRVIEQSIDGYDVVYNGFNITNKRKETPPDEKVTVGGSKTWNDSDNALGTRPQKITVYLVADNAEVMDVREVSEADGWAWKFEGLPKTDNGAEISYSIAEGEVTGYDETVSGYNLTNTSEAQPPAETVTVEGTKTWVDDDNKLGLRPEEITIDLLRDGEVIYKQNVSESEGWKWKFSDLQKTAGDKEISYTIAEEPVAGYSSHVDGYNVTNTVVEPDAALLPARHDPPVQKKVEGDSPAEAGTFVFVLSPNDESYPMPDGATGGTKEMTIKGAGSGEFGIIEFGEAGTYEYTVTEKDVGETGYSYDGATYTIRYEVLDEDADGDGYRDCARTFFKDGEVVEDMESAVFINTYRAPDSPTSTSTTTPTTTTTTAVSGRSPLPNTADTADAAAATLCTLLGAVLVSVGHRHGVSRKRGDHGTTKA